MGKGYSTGIAFDLNSPMGDSTCISCGECMVSCPTGALTNKSVTGTAISEGPGAEGFEAEDLLKIPVFHGVSGTFLEMNRGAIVKRRWAFAGCVSWIPVRGFCRPRVCGRLNRE